MPESHHHAVLYVYASVISGHVSTGHYRNALTINQHILIQKIQFIINLIIIFTLINYI